MLKKILLFCLTLYGKAEETDYYEKIGVTKGRVVDFRERQIIINYYFTELEIT